MSSCGRKSAYSLSTLALAEFGDSRRFWPQSPFLATVAVFGDSAEFGGSRLFWRQSPFLAIAVFGDSSRIRRQSPVLATVALFGDSGRFWPQIVAEIGAYSLQCGQGFMTPAYLMQDFRASVERCYFWTLGLDVGVKSCNFMFLVWHFLFTCSETSVIGCVVQTQCTASHRDRQTDGRHYRANNR